MSDKQEVKGREFTKEELAEYREKLLVIYQEVFATAVAGMVTPLEFLNMVPLLLSMVHAVFHESGDRTWDCDSSHDHIFESIDRMWESVLKDREANNDMKTWIDDPAKAKQLEEMQMRKMQAMMMGAGADNEDDEDDEELGDVAGVHLF